MKINAIPLIPLFAVFLSFGVPGFLLADEAPEENENLDALVSEAQRMARDWAQRIREWSDEGESRTTYLGVVIESVPDVLRDYIDLPKGVGLLFSRIAADSPAERAGLRDNDIIVMFDDQLVVNYSQLSTLIDLKGPGAEVPLQILRKGEEMHLTVVLEERVRKGGGYAVPDVPEPPELPDADEMGVFMERIEEWIPGSVKVLIDENEQVHVDLDDLKEDLEDLKLKVHRITRSSSPAPEIVREYGDLGARRTVVHVKDRTVNYRNEDGKLVIQSSDAGQRAMVWDKGGQLIYSGNLPDDYAESLPREAARLIQSYYQSQEKLQLEANGEQLEIRLNEDNAVPVTAVLP